MAAPQHYGYYAGASRRRVSNPNSNSNPHSNSNSASKSNSKSSSNPNSLIAHLNSPP